MCPVASLETPVHLRPMKGLEDRLENVFGAHEHIGIPESQHAKSCRSQEVVATRIIGNVLGVL